MRILLDTPIWIWSQEAPQRLSTWISESLRCLLAETIPLSHEIALTAYDLSDPFHPDPADRIIVATAMALDLTLATADPRILDYPHVLSMDARS